jgi:hypothetical protein
VADEVELAMEIAVRYLKGDQTAALEGVSQADARQAANTETGFHRAFDGLGVLQLHGNVQVGQDTLQGAVESLAGP